VDIPFKVQILAWPSHEPVASKVPSPFQSRVVTSLLFSFDLPFACFRIKALILRPVCTALNDPSGILQIRAVASPDLIICKRCINGIREQIIHKCIHLSQQTIYPDARSEAEGLHAQAQTSEVCPSKILTSELGM
jgi:hypothetical protein